MQHDLKERLGARWDPDERCWWIPAPHGAPAAAATANVLKEHGFSGVDDAIFAPSSAQREITESFFCDIAEQHGGDVKPDLALRPYQIDGVRALVRSRRMLLADQPGLGKTYQSIAAVLANESLPALVICPATVSTNWVREINAVAPWARVVALTRAPAEPPEAEFVIVTWDSLARYREHLSLPRSVIADESHYAKDPTTKRSRAFMATAADLPPEGMLIALTGTPVVNCHADLLPTLQAINMLCLFGGRQAFLDRYCEPITITVPDKPGPDGKPRWREMDVYRGSKHGAELRRKLLGANALLRRKKSDVLTDLPPKQICMQVVDLDRPWQELLKVARRGVRHSSSQAWEASEQQLTSDPEMEKALATFASDISMPGPREVLKRRLRAMPDSLPSIAMLRRITAASKLPFAYEWISTWLSAAHDEKIVVFGRHREVTTMIADRFGTQPLIGGVSQRLRQSVIDDFDQNPDTRLLVASYEAAGTGTNLHAANNVLFVEQPWTSAGCEQAEDRCHRLRQTRPVTVTYLVAAGTIDEPVWAAVDRKANIAGVVVDGDGGCGGQMSFESLLAWAGSQQNEVSPQTARI